jgi:hypothetical protein
MVRISRQVGGTSEILDFFAQEAPVTWKFDYSSKKLRKNAQNLTLKVDISHLVTFLT